MAINIENFIIKRNDTLPALVVRVKTRGDIDEIIPFNLSGVTATTFSMTDNYNNLKVSSSPAQILCASGGTLQYSWLTGDTDEAGKFSGEFEMLFSDGNKMSIPTNGAITIQVIKDINET